MTESATFELSRRRLLGLLGVSSAALVAAPVLAACSSKSDGNDNAGDGTKRRGGTLLIDVSAEPPTLDPFRGNTPEARRIFRLTNSQVLRWDDSTGQPIPALASEMPTVSADGLEYRITLRTDVKWHDGKAFDADDVVYSYEQIRKKDNASVWAGDFAFVDSVAATSPTQVVVKLKRPFQAMMNKFATTPIISSKVPYEPNKTYAATAMGTGPYKFVSWKSGDRLTLSRNPDYFRADETYIDSIVLRVVKEAAARTTNISNGESGLLTGVDATQLSLLKKEKSVTVKTADKSVARSWIFPSVAAGKPGANTDFRLAVAWAIDRGLIVDQVFGGAAVPASTYLASGSQYYDSKWGTYFGSSADPTKAKDHLSRVPANLISGSLDMYVNNVPESVAMATIIQANLKDIGLEVKVIPEEVGALVARLANDSYDLMLFGNRPITSDYSPDYPYRGMYSTSTGNLSHFGDPKMDQLLDAAISATSNDAAQTAWSAVSEYDVQLQGLIEIVTSRYSEAWRPTLHDYDVSGTSIPIKAATAWVSS